MTERPIPVTEDELHAYVDDSLDAAARAAVEAHLEGHPEDAERVRGYRADREILHALYDTVLDEPIPPAMLCRHRLHQRPWIGRAAAALLGVVVGGAGGWWLNDSAGGRAALGGLFAEDALVAHIVYAPEIRHVVEVAASDEAHLVGWLSKRVGTPIKAPRLDEAGFELVGGRLVPAARAPVAQFMYENTKGERLTLYLRHFDTSDRETAFRYDRRGDVGALYWIHSPLGYAVVGEMDREALLKLAKLVYMQFSP